MLVTVFRKARQQDQKQIHLLRRLGVGLDADVHLTAGHDPGSAWFEPHAA